MVVFYMAFKCPYQWAYQLGSMTPSSSQGTQFYNGFRKGEKLCLYWSIDWHYKVLVDSFAPMDISDPTVTRKSLVKVNELQSQTKVMDMEKCLVWEVE